MKIERNQYLEMLQEPSEERFTSVMHYFANLYAKYLDLDFNNDILPKLNDHSWWEADYGVQTRNGKEIGMSTIDAFRCLVDTKRTFQIARGLKEVVSELDPDNKKNLVAIDAGTGTGILSIIAASMGVKHIKAIEVNTDTAKVTRQFLTDLNFNDRIELIEGDATLLDLQGMSPKANILLSENLASGLFSEPQFEIINNLSRFLDENAEIVPGEAELFVSVGNADWSGVKPELNNIAARRLKSCKSFSSPVKYAEVISKVGMEVPVIKSDVIVHTSDNVNINTLFISTRFKMNSLGLPIYLEQDLAEFLGKTAAFRLSTFVSNGDIPVSINYEAGRNRGAVSVFIDDEGVYLRDPLLYSK